MSKKNNWTPDVKDYYARSQSEIQIERTDPGPAGYRHVLTVAQLRRFLDILPDWEELAVGLDAISIYRGNPKLYGMCNPGVVVLFAWPRDLWCVAKSWWVEEESEVLERIGVEMLPDPDTDTFELRWLRSRPGRTC